MTKKSSVKRFMRYALCLVLTVSMLLGGIGELAGEAETITTADGLTTIWRWERVDSQDDLPTSNGKYTENGETVGYAHPVLFLYSWNGGNYMVDGSNRTSGDSFKFTRTTLASGVIYGAKNFRTAENISHMTMKYAGVDTGNDNIKQYRFRLADAQDDTGAMVNLSLEKDYWFQNTRSVSEYTNVGIVTYNSCDINVSVGRVKMFANISWAKDANIKIDDSNGNVFPERTITTSMGEFVMYVGYMERVSSVKSSFTIGDGQVANYNGQIYIEPGVTITVNKGGVLSVSGTLYNNGAIINNGGDIVVQKDAVIEQLTVGKGAGGGMCLDGGDLVILSGGLVTTGSMEEYTNYRTQLGDGFVVRNGATITNFGTLVVGSESQLLSGATIDNRASGKIYFGFRAASKYAGILSSLDAFDKRAASTYEITSTYDSTKRTVTYTEFVFVDSDVTLSNSGVIHLGTWAIQFSKATGVSAKGSGKIYIQSWARQAAADGSWSPFPTGWESMITE